ncbi:MAG: hypothetical protein AB2A00_13095 [Myxococcota bacterium]
MAATKGPQPKHLDKRVVDRYLRRGVLNDKDFKQYLKDLPDQEGHYDVVEVPEAGADEEEGDGEAAEAQA